MGKYRVVSLSASTGSFNWQLAFEAEYGLAMYANAAAAQVLFVMNWNTYVLMEY
jgi:hypothetical protein